MTTETVHGNGRDHESPVTMIEDIDQLRAAIEDELPRKPTKLSIVAIRGLAGHARDKFKAILNTSYRRPVKRLAVAMDAEFSLHGRQTDSYGEKLLESDSVLDFIKFAQKIQMNALCFLQAFLKAAAIKETENKLSSNIRALREQTHEVCSLALPGKPMNSHNSSIGENHVLLYENNVMNWLRLPGVIPEIRHDTPFENKLYNFTNSNTPTDFARRSIMQQRDALIHDKDILELGPGGGADAKFFLDAGKAKSVEVIDASQFVLDQLRRYGAALLTDQKGKLIVPAEAQDMCDALAHIVSEGRDFDTIYANSSIHFLDGRHLRQLLALVSECLRPGGHFAFAVKAPGARMDGHGILLINDIEESDDYVISGVNDRAWLNLDGQIRHHKSYAVWDHMLGETFTVMDASKSLVRDYATPGNQQLFFNFICQVKKSADTDHQIRIAEKGSDHDEPVLVAASPAESPSVPLSL